MRPFQKGEQNLKGKSHSKKSEEVIQEDQNEKKKKNSNQNLFASRLLYVLLVFTGCPIIFKRSFHFLKIGNM